MPVPPLSPGRLPAATGWRTEAAIIAGLLACGFVLDQFRIYNIFVFESGPSYLMLLADAGSRILLAVPVLVVALHVATRARGRGWRRTGTAIAVMVGAAVLSAAVSLHGLPHEALFIAAGASASTTVALWYEAWMRALMGLLALVIVEKLRARHRAVERLAERHQRSTLVRRQLAYAQLQAIQARVDPQLLFDTLAAVKRLYERDVARAELLLDELTAFLRAALPRLRSARSSLDVEFGLVGCYVRMLRAAGDAAIELEASLPAALAHAAFPAGLLLPLVAGQQAAPRRIGLEAQTGAGGVLHVRVTDSAAPAATAIARLRASLADLYGERAQLRTRGPTDIGLEVPHEHE